MLKAVIPSNTSSSEENECSCALIDSERFETPSSVTMDKIVPSFVIAVRLVSLFFLLQSSKCLNIDFVNVSELSTNATVSCVDQSRPKLTRHLTH